MDLSEARVVKRHAGFRLATLHPWINPGQLAVVDQTGSLYILDAADGHDTLQNMHTRMTSHLYDCDLTACGNFLVWTSVAYYEDKAAAHCIGAFVATPLLRKLCLIESGDRDCAVSAAGHVACARLAPGSHTCLMIASGTRSADERELEGVYVERMFFSASAEWLCVVLAGADGAILVDTSSFEETRLQIPTDSMGFASADGTTFLFLSKPDGNVAVYSVSSVGGKPQIADHCTIQIGLGCFHSIDNYPTTRYAILWNGPLVLHSLIDVADGTCHPWWGPPLLFDKACISADGRLLATCSHTETRIYSTFPGNGYLYRIAHEDMLVPTCTCQTRCTFHGDTLFFEARSEGLLRIRVPRLHEQLARMLSKLFKRRESRQMPSYLAVYFILSGKLMD